MNTFTRFARRCGSVALAGLSFVLPATLGCDSAAETDATVEVTAAALTTSEAEGADAFIGSLAFPRGGSGLTAGERIERLRAHIAEALTCAEVGPVSDGDAVSLTFGTDCAWNGRRWTGTLELAYAADGSSASIDFDGVNVNGGTITGSIDVTSLGEHHVSVVADTTRTVSPNAQGRRAGRVVTGHWEGEYQWDDTSYTIVSADRSVTINGVSATRSADNVVWLKSQLSPESGSASISGFRGKTWSFVFGVVDGVHQITVTRPDGSTRTFDIGGDGELDEG